MTMSGDPKVSLIQAREAIHRADFPEAIKILSEIVVEDSSNAEAWRQLGECYLETRQPDLALEALSRALKYNPADATAHYLLALEADPHHLKAEEFLIKAESLLESREHYRSALKLLYLPHPSVDDLNRALRDLVQSIAIFDRSPASDNLRECARMLFERKQERWIPISQSAELRPWAMACERGYQCLLFKNWVGARAAYDEALSYRVQDAFVHHALGFSFVELGAPNDAVRAWLRVLELDAEYDFTCFGRVEQ